MDESNDVQAIGNISSEVDESHLKVSLSSHCIKAQAFLLNKLNKDNERNRQIRDSLKSANLKLEAEIKYAEQELSSMRTAQDTIRSANVELKKELLLAEEKKAAITKRTEAGVKKYEALWVESKKRFETVPMVQKLLKSKARAETVISAIEDMKNEAQKVYKDIETRNNMCRSLDQKRIIELANYMVHERPNQIKLIEQKTEEIKVLQKQYEDLLKEQEGQDCIKDLPKDIEQELDIIGKEIKSKMTIDNSLPCSIHASVKIDDDSLIPKLELADFDLDSLDYNLDEVKKRTVEIFGKTPINANPIITSSDPKRNGRNDERANEFILSPYIYKPTHVEKPHGYSKSKLINILEDVNLNKNEAYSIVSKIDPEKFQMVHKISADGSKDKDNIMETADIEEIDLTSANREDIIIPPTPFLDVTAQVSQENLPKKQVSFELCTTKLINKDVDKPNECNQSVTSQLDVSTGSDESFMKVNDLILKKHKLDLSPQFVYAKKNMLEKNYDDKVVTSKFFEKKETGAVDSIIDNITDMVTPPEVKADGETSNVPSGRALFYEGNNLVESDNNALKEIPMDIDEMVVSSPKPNKENEEHQIQKPISGLLFTHGTQGIQDAFDVSISTTGYEDSDFPHCIDSSLLLSPKADIQMTDNVEVLSQDVPNFLSGLRKTGLSFFGEGPSTSSKPDQKAQNPQNNFNFNFAGDDKKNRGGLFSMFN